MGERDDARHQIEQKRKRISQLAHEVSRRMTPEYARERAREMARDSVSRTKDRAVESAWFAPLLGAGIGALVARTLQARVKEPRDGGQYGYANRDQFAYPREWSEYPAEGAERDLHGDALHAETAGGDREAGTSLGERAAGMKDRAQEKANDLRYRARAKSEEVTGRFHEATSSLREQLPDRERIRKSTHEDIGLWALGALALGALFGVALPESQREREILEPARHKAQELGEQAKEKVLEKGSDAVDRAREKIESIGSENRQQQEIKGESPGAPPLH